MLLSLVYLVVRVLLRLLVPEGQDQAAKDLEIVVLRHQLNVLRRQVKRPRFRLSDRVFLAAAARRLPRTRWERFLVTPKTLLRWHRSSESGSVGDAFTSESSGYHAASVGTNSLGSSPERSRDGRRGTTHTSKEQEPPAPQPNAELFHLYNPDTDDHFVTMSSSTANQKQASGYQLFVEGGVFTDQVKGTVAIALDDGTTYVFRDKGSTSGTNVAPLYRIEKDRSTGGCSEGSDAA